MNLKFIGSGEFTRAYISPEHPESVYLFSRDKMKQALCEFGYNGYLFPVVRYVYDGHVNEEPVEAFNQVERRLRRTLSEEQLDKHRWMKTENLGPTDRGIKGKLPEKEQRVWNALRYASDHYTSYHSMFNAVITACERFGVYDYYKEELADMIGTIWNYTDEIGLEISPRNVRMKDGNLVLMDIFYCTGKDRNL